MRLALPILLALSLAVAACGAGRPRFGQPVHPAERVTRADVAVTDDQFPQALRDLLASEPMSKERSQRLTGVVARQMTRVSERFKAKNRENAIASFAGAMYLVRAGELTNEMLGQQAYDALRGATEEFAKRGDESRARASYELLYRIAPPAEKADLKGHLDAIAAWTRDTGGSGPVQSAGALESAAVTRHLLEPSAEARDEAVSKTLDWIEKAIALKQARRSGKPMQVTREEGGEAVRALETGTTVLVAIYLRDGDPHSALSALERANARDPQMTRAELLGVLKAVVERPDSDRWLDLARYLRSRIERGMRGEGEEEDFSRDAELLRVASFVASCEAYRLDTTSPDAAGFVAATLVDVGMGDAAPAVLVDAVKASKDPRFLGFSLAVTRAGIERGLESDEPEAARRAFRAAEPILTAADAQKLRVQSSPARLYALMGELELREGRLDAARRLLDASAERERSGAVMLNLARLDAHSGKTKEALERLAVARDAEDVAKDTLLRAEVLLLTSDIQRQQGDANAARKPLSDALRDLAKARSSPEEDRAQVERLIARVLDRFGASKSADKALERALEASSRDKRTAAFTIGQMVGRAFVKGDLEAARDGLARAQVQDLGREDLVYDAIWVRLLERQARKADDPTAEKILLGASDDPRWIGKIAAFGAGKIKSADLVAAATTPTQRTEALFYAAMDRRVSGDAKGADEGLKQVVSSPGIELVEFNFARDMLDGARAHIGGPVPEVGLP